METFDCYIDRKVTMWVRDKYRIEAGSKKDAVSRLKTIAKNPEYNSPEFVETETLFDTEEPVMNKKTNVLCGYIYDKETFQDEEVLTEGFQ